MRETHLLRCAAQDAHDALATLSDRSATARCVLGQWIGQGPLQAPGPALRARLDAAAAAMDAVDARIAAALPVQV